MDISMMAPKDNLEDDTQSLAGLTVVGTRVNNDFIAVDNQT